MDRTGLVPFFLLPLLGALAGPAMGFAVPYGIAQLTDYFKRDGEGGNTSAVAAMNTILPMLTDTLGVGKLGGAMAGGAAGAAPALGAGVQGMLTALLSRPEVIQMVTDAAVGFLDKNLPPPNSFAGGMAGLLGNLNLLPSTMGELENIILKKNSTPQKNSLKIGNGDHCTPTTQPRNAQGQFAPCGHE